MERKKSSKQKGSHWAWAIIRLKDYVIATKLK